ncbi:CDP-glycerol:poly(glycerophosphate) glycerophosphotransferase [Homoserinimonas aerilata]|uniref:CDP-glycerol:poly(Glycerophosphate) glycerophosphotransferase n=1 Tax=Homoserinimonas aerilata TaxID=1162970 RepID=A0A542YHA4_9MICO|nr:CDP-glycerol glycerophosphotransferase family protein [Homoserinimonas aerilata]TQL47446.1 CDP-glycerol:poly(glycerophosphate) glycerophosphotransferase [Homoserinimonas aerilata]
MPVIKDLKTARRLVTSLLRSRRTRHELARRLPGVASPPPRSIQIAVYFADSRVNLYQIRQWYGPLAALAKKWPVAIISRSPSAMLKLADEAPVPVQYLRKVADLEHFVEQQDIKIVFYVNQNARNFQMFRYGRMWHVFINHGESDKMYMTTNQFKAYDYSFIAGRAAYDRLRQKLWNFDVDNRTIQIGRPQADHFAGELPYTPDDRVVVLYSPTWEGDRAAAAYGSVASHGVALSSALLADRRFRLIYRPHPRSGVIDPDFKRANESIIAEIAAANQADPSAQHVYDDGPSLGWQLAAADVAVTDVSAMVYDRLATGKPLIVTRPVSPLTDVDEAGFLGAAEWLTADAAGDIIAQVERVRGDVEALDRLHYWVERHFGDTSPGAATARFHDAVERLVGVWHEHAAIHLGDRQMSEADPFVDDDDEDPTTE